jgi:hypothetical protein
LHAGFRFRNLREFIHKWIYQLNKYEAASPILGLKVQPRLSFLFQFGKKPRELPWDLTHKRSGLSQNFEEPAGMILSFHFPGQKARATSGRNILHLGRQLWFGFFRRRSGFLLGCFRAAPAEQRQSVFGAKGEAADGLFAGSAQGDVDAAVVGQAHGQKIPV